MAQLAVNYSIYIKTDISSPGLGSADPGLATSRMRSEASIMVALNMAVDPRCWGMPAAPTAVGYVCLPLLTLLPTPCYDTARLE